MSKNPEKLSFFERARIRLSSLATGLKAGSREYAAHTMTDFATQKIEQSIVNPQPSTFTTEVAQRVTAQVTHDLETNPTLMEATKEKARQVVTTGIETFAKESTPNPVISELAKTAVQTAAEAVKTNPNLRAEAKKAVVNQFAKAAQVDNRPIFDKISSAVDKYLPKASNFFKNIVTNLANIGTHALSYAHATIQSFEKGFHNFSQYRKDFLTNVSGALTIFNQALPQTS